MLLEVSLFSLFDWLHFFLTVALIALWSSAYVFAKWFIQASVVRKRWRVLFRRMTRFSLVPAVLFAMATQLHAQKFFVENHYNRIPTSTVAGPLYYSIENLESSLNLRFRDLLYRDDSYFNNDNDGVISYAMKSNDIRVSIVDGVVKTQVPMTVKVNYRAFYPIKVSLWFFKKTIVIDQKKEFIFDIIVHFNSKGVMNKDLSVSAKTEYKIDWITTPYIVLYKFFKFNLKAQVNEVFAKVFANYSKKIDEVVESQFMPSKYVKKMTQLFNDPLLIDEKNALWVKVNMLNPVYVSPIKMVNNRYISLNVESKAQIGMVLSQDADQVIDLLGRTDIKNVKMEWRDRKKKLVYMDLVAFISLNSLTSFVTEKIEEKKPLMKVGRFQAEMNEIYFSLEKELGGIGESRLVADVFLSRVEKSGRGDQLQIRIFFHPTFDAKTGVIKMTSVDYKLYTESLLLSFASAAANKKFKEAITNNVAISITDYIDSVKELLRTELKNRRINKNLQLNAAVDTIDVKSIVLQDEMIRIGLALSGRVDFYLDQLF